MVYTPTEVLQIRLQHPSHRAPSNPLMERGERMVCAQPRSPSTRTRQNILLVNGRKHLGRPALECPVGDTWPPPGGAFPACRASG